MKCAAGMHVNTAYISSSLISATDACNCLSVQCCCCCRRLRKTRRRLLILYDVCFANVKPNYNALGRHFLSFSRSFSNYHRQPDMETVIFYSRSCLYV